MSKKSLVLIDGSNYLFRAYHAMPEFTNAAGEPTGAIYGVITMIHKLYDEQKPDYIAVVFDAKGKNFRNDLYAEYKAHRPPMPEDLASQIEPIHRIIHAEGYPILMIDNVEADDVIATLARHAEQQGLEVLVSTGDKDLAQIVTPHTRLIDTMKNRILDPAGVEEKFGVPPDRIIDYLTLVGDSVDNVPGVPKVGPKTAVKWLKEYGSLDGVIEHAGEIGGKVGESLRASLDQLPVSQELVRLRSDLELGMAPDTLVRDKADYASLAEQYRRWGFRSWLVRLPEEWRGEDPPEESDAAPTTCSYETVLEMSRLEVWLERLRQAEIFAIDTETTSLNYMQAEIVGVSMATEPGQAAYVPLAHTGPGAPDQLDRDQVMARLKPLLESTDHHKVGHHIKYDMNVLARCGITLAGIRHDTMLESYVLDSTATRHDMDSLALRHLDYRTIHYEDVTGKGARQIGFEEVEVETASTYAAEDADITLRLHRKLWPQLVRDDGLRKVYEEIEMPLVPVLARMEQTGVLIDSAMLERQSRELATRMLEVEKQAQALAGSPFNIASPKQIQTILYDELKLPVLEKTPKGQPSTAESVLQELAAEHALPALILEHRMLSKLRSTYTEKLPGLIDPVSGRVHTSYHQAVASTGRLSSSDPNLQNIPVRSEEGRRIRRAFVAPDGYVLLAADYSQIELRIMAHLSGDESLLAAFYRNEDIHRSTAAEIFSVTPDTVTTDQRRAAKAINFGLIYGMSAFGLARQLGIERGEANDYVERYFARYPAVRGYMDSVREQAREQGYVETVFKRRLYLPEIRSRNAARRQYAERTAINAPMQGTAADIIKRAMIRIDRELIGGGTGLRMIMQVHDELVFEVPVGRLDELQPLITGIMCEVPELQVPVAVDVGTGTDWEQAH